MIFLFRSTEARNGVMAGPVPLLPQRIGQTSDNDQYVSDNEHGHSYFTRGDTKLMKRHAEEILHHERSTQPDGTVIITPRPPQLPNEILARIINHVDETPQRAQAYLQHDTRQIEQQLDLWTCTLVNKQFYAIANPVLWQEPVLELGLEVLLNCLAANEQPLGHHIKRLYLDNTTCTDTEFLRLMPHIPHLASLLIDNTDDTIAYFPPMTSTSLQHLPRYCSQLTSLTLARTPVSDAIFLALGQHCHQLTDLYLQGVEGLRDDFLSALSRCPLKKFQLCLLGPERILTDTMMMTLTRFQDLEELSLSLREPSTSIMTIANNTTTTVPWPRLKDLHLGSSYAIDDATFLCFLKQHPHLQVVYLDGATLTDASLDAMAVSLYDLRRLVLRKVHGISSGGVRRWIQNGCQRLVSAEFRHCDQIVARDVLATYKVKDRFCLRFSEHDIANIRRAQTTGNHHCDAVV
ncbi:unnamed protein product [Absidia cylindrospora]